MLAGTMVYVNAGTQLGKLESLSGILSPALLGFFALLGIFPLIARKIVEVVHSNKVFANWKKPARFDRNIVVIGGGSAGLVTAYIGAAVKAKVTLVEKHKLGGDCLNTGCVPSKALIRSAKLLSQMARSKEFGIDSARAEFSFSAVMERVQSVIKTIDRTIQPSVQQPGRRVVHGAAKIVSPWTVEITHDDGSRQALTTRSIVVATGARPFVPPIPGIEQVGYLTSDNLWELRELPSGWLSLAAGDRLRADPGLRPLRCPGQPGRNGAAPATTRRPGSFRTGRRTLPCRGRGGAGRSSRQGVRDRRQRKNPDRRT